MAGIARVFGYWATRIRVGAASSFTPLPPGDDSGFSMGFSTGFKA